MSNAEIHGKLLENTITNHLFRLQLKEIHTLTKSILQLYETLPLILNNNNLSDFIYEDTTSLFPEISVR